MRIPPNLFLCLSNSPLWHLINHSLLFSSSHQSPYCSFPSMVSSCGSQSSVWRFESVWSSAASCSQQNRPSLGFCASQTKLQIETAGHRCQHDNKWEHVVCDGVLVQSPERKERELRVIVEQIVQMKSYSTICVKVARSACYFTWCLGYCFFFFLHVYCTYFCSYVCLFAATCIFACIPRNIEAMPEQTRSGGQ